MPEERVQGDTEEDWTRLIDALERKRAISALMYLGCKGRVKEVTIRDDIFPNPQQTEIQLGHLQDVGLVDMERDEIEGSRRTAKFWSLTMRGQAVESMLEVVELCAEGRISPVRIIQACEYLMGEKDPSLTKSDRSR